MKKELLFKFFALSLFMLFSIGKINAQEVFISQNCDPKANYVPDRFAEIYNPTAAAVDLTGWTLENVQNGSVAFTWDLSGTIAPGVALVCGNADATNQTITPDFTATWAGNSFNGKGGDGTVLKNASGDVVDSAVQDDATGKFENGQMVRNPDITSPSVTYDATQWTFSAVENAVDASPGEHTVNQAAIVAKDLFFSEYVEGSGNNKAIEIFNGTGADVDLSGYTIKQSHNGTGWGADGIMYVLPLTGTITSGDVYVISASDASAAILAVADLALVYSNDQGAKIPFFTGDDALGLFKGNLLIDVIGTPDIDPGYGWDVAGVTEATENHTLDRKPTITQGDTVWATSAGTDTDNSEWIVHDIDYVTDLGSHTFGVSTDTTAPTFTSVPDNGDVEVNINNPVVLTFDEAIQNIDGSEITDANVASLLTLKETDASGADVPFTATIDADKKVITVTPDAALKINQVYYGAINPVEDAAGNATAMAEMTFTTMSKYDVTFNVDMSLVNGFDPSTDSVFIAGTFPSWEEPGTNADFKMSDADSNMVYSLTIGLDLPIADDGKIEYKFFINAGWNTWGEWNAGDNRKATITGDTTLNAVFGNRGEAIVLDVPFTQNFDYATASAPISLAGWTNANVATGGVTKWIGKEYKSNKYAQISSYGSKSTGADEVWMITPGINMDATTDEQLSFDVAIGYWNYDGLSVKISTDFDGTVADIAAATWTDVTSDFTIPSEPTSGYGTFATVGRSDVSGYAGTMYVAFVYNGNATDSQTTTYQIDSVMVQSTTGINNIGLSNQVKLYPNPGNGIFNIALNGTLKGEVNVKVMDITGRVVFEKSYTQPSAGINVNISNETSSMYFITLSDASRTIVKKFMKR